jgi:hypothetical protein
VIPAAVPGHFFLRGEWRVSIGTPFFGWFLVAFLDFPALDHNVVFVGYAVNPDATERDFGAHQEFPGSARLN